MSWKPPALIFSGVRRRGRSFDKIGKNDNMRDFRRDLP
jgi:hypothetical protein